MYVQSRLKTDWGFREYATGYKNASFAQVTRSHQNELLEETAIVIRASFLLQLQMNVLGDAN